MTVPACVFQCLFLCVPVAAGQDLKLQPLLQCWDKQNLAAPVLKVKGSSVPQNEYPSIQAGIINRSVVCGSLE